MKYGYSGAGSMITKSIRSLMAQADSDSEEWVERDPRDLPTNLDYYFMCAGFLAGASAMDIKPDEIQDTMNVNMIAVIAACERIFKASAKAKICIMGSMSGINGSYDMTYAAAKAGLHMYVKNKALSYKGQHIVCIAPTIIEDSWMTKSRKDYDETIRRGRARRLGRWLLTDEVARTACFAIGNPAMCNTIIQLTGGIN